VADQTNILFLHVDNLGFGGLSNGIIEAFQASVRREPLIPMGAPLDYVVTRNSPER
jgi:hypothetical protein